jgi:hypothetical protein
VGYTGSVGFTGSSGAFAAVGYTGSVGFTGSSGAFAAVGYTGSVGFTGSSGAFAAVGYTGSVGFTGSSGAFAAVGYTGSSGAGYTGSRGELGYTGSVGFTGSRGFTGSVGYTGSLGFTGSVGFTGSQGAGFTGSVGYMGSRGYTGSVGYTGSEGVRGQRGEVGYTGSLGLGAVGYTGSRGAIGYTGSQGPSGTGGISAIPSSTAVSPGFPLAVDANTGLFGNTDDQIGISAGGAARLLITNTQTQVTNELVGSTAVFTSGTTQVSINTNVGSGTTNGLVLNSDGNLEIIRSAGGAYIDFKNTATENYDVRISQNGNLSELLMQSLTGTFALKSLVRSGQEIGFTSINTAGAYMGTFTNTNLELGVNTSKRMHIIAGGNTAFVNNNLAERFSGGAAEIRDAGNYSDVNPVYTFWDNNTTGMGNPAQNQINFIVSGGEISRINSLGQTVGTTNSAPGSNSFNNISGISLSANGRAHISSSSGAYTLNVNRITQDTNLIQQWSTAGLSVATINTVGDISARSFTSSHTFENPRVVIGNDGNIELTREGAQGPYIDFKGNRGLDYDIRLQQTSVDSTPLVFQIVGRAYEPAVINTLAFETRPAFFTSPFFGDPYPVNPWREPYVSFISYIENALRFGIANTDAGFPNFLPAYASIYMTDTSKDGLTIRSTTLRPNAVGVSNNNLLNLWAQSATNVPTNAISFATGAGNGVIAGTISIVANTTSYNTTSDYRIKKDVTDLANALHFVNSVRAVSFNFANYELDYKVFGFIAHEVDDIIKGVVIGEKDAVDSMGNPRLQQMDSSKLVPVLWNAIRELNQLVVQQQQQLESFSAQLNDLKSRMN